MLKHISKEWKFWLGTAIAFVAALATLGSCIATFREVPSSEDIAQKIDIPEVAKRIDAQELANYIDLDELAKRIKSESGVTLKTELTEITSAKTFTPPRKPDFNKIKDDEKNVIQPQLTKLIAECIVLVAGTYSIPPPVLFGILKVENGRNFEAEGPFSDGSYLLGLMRISSNLIPDLANKWEVNEATAFKWVKDDPCTNIGVSAWILRKHMNEASSLGEALELYGETGLGEGKAYRDEVIDKMREAGLLK